jgi:hypothetical protein
MSFLHEPVSGKISVYYEILKPGLGSGQVADDDVTGSLTRTDVDGNNFWFTTQNGCRQSVADSYIQDPELMLKFQALFLKALPFI